MRNLFFKDSGVRYAFAQKAKVSAFRKAFLNFCLLKLQYEVCLFSSPPAPTSCLSLFYKYCAYNIILQLLKLKARAESFNRLYLDLVFSPVRNMVVDLTNVIILWGRISSWR